MDYDWYLSEFDRQKKMVSLIVTDCDINELITDTAFLNSMALRHDASYVRVEVHDDDEIVTITFVFSTEANLLGFCKEFLTPKVEDTSEKSE